MALPSLAQLVRATLNVLEKNGIEAYLPTIVLEDDFFVIEDIPDDVDHRKALLDTLARDGLMDKDFLFAVRSAEGEVTVGEHAFDELEFVIIRKLNDGYHQAPLAVCDWWEKPT